MPLRLPLRPRLLQPRSAVQLVRNAGATASEEGESSKGDSIRRGEHRPHRSVPPASSWLLTDEGLKFRDPSIGPNWLGGDVVRVCICKDLCLLISPYQPFPMNRSFKPPPPLSDKTREEIYVRFMSNPEKYNIRELSSIYGISLKRIDAILRLKGLERSWEKVSKRMLIVVFLLPFHNDEPKTD